jgi:hypothetical protein
MNSSPRPTKASPLSGKSSKAAWLSVETTTVLHTLSRSLQQALADHQAMLAVCWSGALNCRSLWANS